jgi:tetratricopeptide (TPR) repeat protein
MKSSLTSVVIGILALIVGLTALDQFLARMESSELHSTAERSYVAGTRLLKEGRAAEAVDQFRNAHVIERDNREYELALIAALTEVGKTADAGMLMDEVLNGNPNVGRTNLIAARLMVKEGKIADAEAYYHRAIYGEWPDNPTVNQQAVRMELIDLLSKRGKKQELLAELISLEAEAGKDPEIQKRLAKLFLSVNSPARAASIYQAMVAKNPRDVDAYEGLGQAELEQGEYPAAHAAFDQAFRRDPNNPSIRSHLQTLNTVVEIDPTVRRLTSEEKYRRSRRILEMTTMGLRQCISNHLVGSSDEVSKVLRAAEATTASKPPAHITNELAEGILNMAEMVWRAQNQACAGTSPPDEALALIMKKLAS